MSVVRELSDLVGAAFVAAGLGAEYGEVVVSQRQDLAQFQCNGALAAAKEARISPRDLATVIQTTIEGDPRLGEVGIAGPGFLNISMTDAYLAERLEMAAGDQNLGVPQSVEQGLVVVDYGGPNIAKALHVGHLRPALIGESLKRINAAVGRRVVGDVHLGDWGLPMGQLLAGLGVGDRGVSTYGAITAEALEETYPVVARRYADDPDFQERARAATVALQEGDPDHVALWERLRSVSVDVLDSVYNRLGVGFELWLGESSVAGRLDGLVSDLVAREVGLESDGAYVIPVAEPTDTMEVPPLILTNSRGAATYAATDLATIADRVERSATEIVYVVDFRQSLHFTQVFRAARIAGIVDPGLRLVHAGCGTINGPDGAPFGARTGGPPRLEDLMDDVVELAERRLDEHDLAIDVGRSERAEIARLVGLAALKFGELANHRTTNYRFDPERFTRIEGRTGPYLLYVAVRAGSILTKAAEQGLEPGSPAPAVDDQERALALLVLQWPDVVERALTTNSPNTIADYAYELSGGFNGFYNACHILSATDRRIQESWLALVALTRRVLVAALDLLVIEVPERM